MGSCLTAGGVDEPNPVGPLDRAAGRCNCPSLVGPSGRHARRRRGPACRETYTRHTNGGSSSANPQCARVCRTHASHSGARRSVCPAHPPVAATASRATPTAASPTRAASSATRPPPPTTTVSGNRHLSTRRKFERFPGQSHRDAAGEGGRHDIEPIPTGVHPGRSSHAYQPVHESTHGVAHSGWQPQSRVVCFTSLKCRQCFLKSQSRLCTVFRRPAG
jgi:hypothetical protein